MYFIVTQLYGYRLVKHVRLQETKKDQGKQWIDFNEMKWHETNGEDSFFEEILPLHTFPNPKHYNANAIN